MNSFKIGSHDFGGQVDGPYILAEIGLNHNGDFDLARRMIDEAVACGVNGVKFQSYHTAGFLHPDLKAAYEIFQNCELSAEQFQKLKDHTHSQKCDFISTPLSFDYVQILHEMGADAIKIASGDMTYYDLIEAVTETKLPVIISSGMASFSEISDLMEKDFLKDYPCVLLHCISNYPPKLEDINLRVIHTLGEKFDCPVGLSDHSIGTAIGIASVALGARFIEKHFTVDRELDGPDQKMSMTPHEMKELVERSKDVYKSLGSWEKPEVAAEIPVKEIARRGLYASKTIAGGEVLSNHNSRFLRPPNSINPARVSLNHGGFRCLEEIHDSIEDKQIEEAK